MVYTWLLAQQVSFSRSASLCTHYAAAEQAAWICCGVKGATAEHPWLSMLALVQDPVKVQAEAAPTVTASVAMKSFMVLLLSLNDDLCEHREGMANSMLV